MEIKIKTSEPEDNLSTLSENSKQDWYEYCQKITPLPPRYTNRISPNTPKPYPSKRTPSHTSSDIHDFFASSISPQEESLSAYIDPHAPRWSRHPAGKAQWRRWLAQHPDRWIDLHGHTLDSAFHALKHCLHEALGRKHRLILCIHGKGLRSPQGEAVLRRTLRTWIVQHPEVIAYSAAPKHLGGDGATLIWLRAHPPVQR